MSQERVTKDPPPAGEETAPVGWAELPCVAGERLRAGDVCTLRVDDGGQHLVYRCDHGEARWGAASRDYRPGEVVELARGGRVIDGRLLPDAEAQASQVRDELAAGAARIARTLQAKGYLVIVTPVAELYPANGQGGEPAIELVLINPAGGERTPVLLLAGTLAAMERGAAQHPPAGLRLAVAGGLATH